MSEMLKRLDLEDLKSVNGGQIYFSFTENDGPSWCVPWPAIRGVCTYYSEEMAVKRAQKLGISSDVKYCNTFTKAQELASLAAFGHKITQELEKRLLNHE